MAIPVHASKVLSYNGNPVALMASRARLAKICKQYWPSVPISQLFAAVRPFADPVNEDGSPWEGFMTGPIGKASVDLEGTEMKLHLQWYRMESGLFEINAYIG